MGVDRALMAWAVAHGLFVRVDRRTPWGNPFRIGRDGDREAVVAKFRDYLPHKDGLLGQLASLRGKALGCHCAPEMCHADVLADLANAAAPAT
jgi:hypothetical protein